MNRGLLEVKVLVSFYLPHPYSYITNLCCLGEALLVYHGFIRVSRSPLFEAENVWIFVFLFLSSWATTRPSSVYREERGHREGWIPHI